MSIARWIKKQCEKSLGEYYEGAKFPDRLKLVVDAFARNPKLGVKEWERFARAYGAACYRDGFVRGFENAERDPDEKERLSNLPPEVVADRDAPGWRDSPAFDANKEPPAVDEAATRSLEDMMSGRSRI